MKKLLVFIFAIFVTVSFSTSALASSTNYIYKKYNGSNFSVGSYAESIESISYGEIEVINRIEVNGVIYDHNKNNEYNDNECKTPEIATTSYYSTTTYHSLSEHSFWDSEGIFVFDVFNVKKLV